MPQNQDLQAMCQRGQDDLVATDYLAAERKLVEAERLAEAAGDFDTLSRLYMPLQEARRQRRHRCGEGVVRLDLLAVDAADELLAEHVLKHHPHGQLLVAGWASLAPSLAVRQLAWELGMYVETYLAAVYPVAGQRAVVVVPNAQVALPPAEVGSLERLQAMLPPHSLLFHETELPAGPQPGTDETFARTMALWEKLHAPFLAEADATPDPRRRLEAYRRTIEVDYACELAHQKLSHTAAELARTGA
ncbi:MAG: hypothetical protein ACFCVE_11755 [Phycisphaerae bacterium]